mgnify:CR=1 FL=1
MNSLKTFTLVSALVTLTACGNLEWPPESGSAGYGVSQPGLVNGRTAPRRQSPRLSVQGLSAPFPGAATDRNHLVVAGETLSRIAQAYGVDVYQMAILNQLEPPFRIYVGQSLSLPKSAGKPVQLAAFRRTEVVMENDASGPLGETPVLTAPEPLPPNPLQVTPGVKPSVVKKSVPSQKVAALSKTRPKVKRAISTEPETDLPPVHKGSAFIWPVRGNLISRFGKKGEGLRNDGVNIVADRGTVVRAARSGIVAYAGNELRGFGNLLLIKHAHGWVTAYAHNEILLVRRGQKVKRGQVVAKVGDSGNVGRPQLHFEIDQLLLLKQWLQTLSVSPELFFHQDQ